MSAWVMILIFRGAIHFFPTDTIGIAYFATEKACVNAAQEAIRARHRMNAAPADMRETYLCVPNPPEKKP